MLSVANYSINGKKIKNRRKITLSELDKYFKANKIDLTKYKYVCRKCYSLLNQMIGTSDILEQVNKLSRLQIKENNYSTIKNRINFN